MLVGELDRGTFKFERDHHRQPLDRQVNTVFKAALRAHIKALGPASWADLLVGMPSHRCNRLMRTNGTSQC
jgi:hypothetical protein